MARQHRFISKLLVFLFIVSLTAVSTLVAYRFATGELFGNGIVEAGSFGDDGIEVNIPKGANTTTIATLLKQHNLISSTFGFRLMSKLNGFDGRYKVGVHVLHPDMGYEQIMETLTQVVEKDLGKKFTIIEGFYFKDSVDAIIKSTGLNKDEFIKVCNYEKLDYKFLLELKPQEGRENRLEGYLFPDTYIVASKAKPVDVLKKVLNRFNEKFPEEYYKRAKELKMTVDQVITLASIIEKEARVAEDRPKISAVFHNRLKSKSYKYLESCATIQYILGFPKENLTTEDTRIPSIYNTYTNAGLPPGPICSPGEESIKAALYPAQEPYLFFVAKGDGSHYFSKTYNEHINAKNRYSK